MTEDQAKTRWCPFALTHARKYDTKMREVNDDLCIGSACMAWRWRIEWASGSVEHRALKPSEDDASVTSGGVIAGYCGLAGKP